MPKLIVVERDYPNTAASSRWPAATRSGSSCWRRSPWCAWSSLSPLTDREPNRRRACRARSRDPRSVAG